MNIQVILDFLKQLKANNNREWFAAHKDSYLEAKKSFEELVTTLIPKIGEIDEDVKYLTPPECIYRIYRDVRFSPDKSPYKTYFGAYMAPRGGRKSILGGYYVHLEPDSCMLGGGIYCPEPGALKKIRQSVYENYDELEEILNDPQFVSVFGKMYSDESLKKAPAGFPADFKGMEHLKFKHFLASHFLTDSAVLKEDLTVYAPEVFKALRPFNRFFNEVIINQ